MRWRRRSRPWPRPGPALRRRLRRFSRRPRRRSSRNSRTRATRSVSVARRQGRRRARSWPSRQRRRRPAKGSALAVVIPDDVSPIGFDSTGALRRRAAAKRRPGEPKPPPRPAARASTGPPQQGVAQTAPPQIAARAAYADAYKPPDAVQRRSPPLPEQDAFEPVGVRAGSFLVRRSLEVTRGYDSNPSRVMDGPPSAFTVVVPELQVRSLWSRDELAISLRGSYTLYDTLPSSDRPMAEATINRRFDVTRDTKIDLENRFYLSTDYPGSPNLQAGLAKLPIYMTYGLSAGLTQRFNRLELTCQGHRRLDLVPGFRTHRRQHIEQPRPRLRPVRRRAARELRSDARHQAVR